MSSYKNAPINTVHPFLRMSARNKQCFSHTSVCFHYRPNNCSMLWEGKHFQDTCKCSCRFDQNKETVVIPKVHLHWQMLTGLFYIEFSSILSLRRTFKLLNSPILTPLNMPKTGWPRLPHTVTSSTSSQTPLEESFLPATRSTGREGVPSLKRRGRAGCTSTDWPKQPSQV